MITLGAKWRVGDGRCIRIYGENWIPVEGLGKVISPRTSLAANALVAELIHPVSGWWDSQIIDSNFLPFEAQRIKPIPISSVAWEDTLIWPKSSDGTYSVKTGYRTLCEESSGDFASVSGTALGKFSGLEYGTSQYREKSSISCGGLVQTRYPRSKTYGEGRQLVARNVKYATPIQKIQFMHCGTVKILEMCGSVISIGLIEEKQPEEVM